MDRLIATFIIVLCTFRVVAQETDSVSRAQYEDLFSQQIEALAERNDLETDFSEFSDQLQQLKHQPVNINSSNLLELRRLFFLNELQLNNLLRYTSTFGQMISVYELQMIEGFDQGLITQMIPFITLNYEQNERFSLSQALKKGHSELFLRWQRVLEQQAGYIKPSDPAHSGSQNSYFLGNPEAFLTKYTFNYRDRLRFGLLGEKDAGEPFTFKADTLPKGFDFYSFHFYLRNIGHFKYLAIGDYHLQFGQGLTLGTGFMFGKSPGILYSGHYTAEIRPHNSGNEFAFMRGIATTYSLGKFDLSVFYSNRNIDANLVKPDTAISEEEYVSSIQETGYHRTKGELSDRHVLNQQVYGGHITYFGPWYRIGSTAYHTWHDMAIEPRRTPYNSFYPSLQANSYLGVDYNIAFKQLMLYGEVTQQLLHGMAMVHGFNFTPDPQFTFSTVYRNYPRNYLNLFSNAFGENTNNNNEKGLYVGILTTPFRKASIITYVDIYSFPWLKYRVDAPSKGSEYSFQLDYRFTQKASVSFRARGTSNPLNKPDPITLLNKIINVKRSSYRLAFDYEAFEGLSLRNRLEFTQRQLTDSASQVGYLFYQDLLLHPKSKPWSLILRYSLFKTKNYDTRLYAYESDLPYSYSVPSFFGGGNRYYIYFRWQFHKFDEIGIRFSQTHYGDRDVISSGNTQIKGNSKSEIKVMLNLNF